MMLRFLFCRESRILHLLPGPHSRGSDLYGKLGPDVYVDAGFRTVHRIHSSQEGGFLVQCKESSIAGDRLVIQE